MPRCRRRPTAWLLLCALILATMAPAVSRALALAQGSMAPWSVVCSAPTDAPLTPSGDGSHAPLHCVWCSLHPGHLAPPPAALALHGPALQHLPAVVQLRVPRQPLAWLAAQARAPPSRSA